MAPRNLRAMLSLIVAFVLFTLVSSVHVQESQIDRREVAQEPRRGEYLNRNISPLESRSLSEWRLENILLVSDIDGNLHGLDRATGSSIWELPIEDPLVRVHREKEGNETSEHSNVVWIVEPSKDGLLYYFTPEFGLNRLPTSIKNLVMESPFSLSGDDKIYTGSRKTSLYSINVRTGQIKNQFGQSDDDNCPVPNVYKTPHHDSARGSDETVMIGKSTYELSIHSKLDSSVVWNLTFSQWGPNNIDADLIMQNTQSRDNLYFTPFFDKSLLAINKVLGTPSWIGRLLSLAVDVFDVYSHGGDEFAAIPHPLNLLNELQATEYEKSQNLCFINKTASGTEWFAMSFRNFPALVKLAPTSPYLSALRKHNRGFYDDSDIDKLKRTNVLDDTAEFYFSGVHEIFDLDSGNLYQPVARFKPTKRIGDGNDINLPPLAATDTKNIPSLISGIFFADDKKGLATVDRNQPKDLNSNPASFYTNLPIRYETHTAFDDLHRHEPVSLLRRVSEDLLVMSILVGALLGFRKISHWAKSRNSRQHKSEKISLISPTSNEVEIQEKIDKPLPLVPEPISSLSPADSGSSTLVEDDNQIRDKPRKKVDFVSPGEAEKDEQDSENGLETDDETESQVAITKKKRKRGSRGGKRSNKVKRNATKDDDEEYAIANGGGDDTEELPAQPSLLRVSPKVVGPRMKLLVNSNLIISKEILGVGSHGTIVYKGTFENRPVAVKQMLDNFYHLADHEVRLLQESDDHPNVIRYFCSQSSDTGNFLYIALELCVCSLAELVEKPDAYPEPLRLKDRLRNDVLLQLVNGLHYLHSLKIVHRDLKPQNILVGEPSNRQKQENDSTVRLLISDFGLCKKLDADQSSFRATTNHAASGTMGWRAPELLLLHDLHEISPQAFTSTHSEQSSMGGESSENNGQGKRLTKAIDIFSLGCVFYYILSGGGHPFGDRYLREGNIICGKYDLSHMPTFCPDDHVEAHDLIKSMIGFSPNQRPNTAQILKHPYFWSTKKKMEFLLKVSDRFESERRDPPSALLLKLEEIGPKIHGGDWLAKFDEDFINNLGKYRKYSTAKLMDLLRAFRNKLHHFNDMPPELQSQMSPVPQGFYQYFNRKFPNLLMEVHGMIRNTLQDEFVFEEFL
ncbi:hypothetical protein PUMCH_002158 [Australozyma saopauloensis]|uniref:non-specific serine/threonine protein kinase n=1 Tax=Australozyma saopauloensis TaxID=291208 RepID=A0AAX4H8H0_9ASCO|nr:hypothetical protein PUMCH_002158 [[Candida] saopauloensis]